MTHILSRRFVTSLLLAAMAIISSISFTSCIYDDGWYPTPPNSWNNTFYDSRLNGYWQLMQINSQNVSMYDTNFLYFGGNGRGRYYYYERGVRYWEQTAYWCQDPYSGNTYQINLQYETSGQPTTMNYWFTDNGMTLWLQWRNSYGLQTYLYRAINGAPW